MNTVFCRSIALLSVLFVAGCVAPSRPEQNVTDQTRVRLAKALLANGDAAGAAEAMRTPEARMNTLEPDDMLNAQILITAGKVDAGLAVAKAALAVRPKDIDFALGVATLAVNAGRWADAENIYRDISQRNPLNIEALNGQAVVSAQQGNLADADALLRKALALSPHNVPARTNLALVLLLSGQVDATIPVLEELDRSDPSPQITAMLTTARQRRAAATPVPQAPETPVVPALFHAADAPVAQSAEDHAVTPVVAPPPATQTAYLVASPVAADPPVDTPAVSPPAEANPAPIVPVPVASQAPQRHADAGAAWSCPNICVLFHSMFGQKANAQDGQ